MHYLIELTEYSSASATTIVAVAGGGQFRNGTTWIGGIVPTAGDIAIIPSGVTVTYTVTINTATTQQGRENWANPTLYVYGTFVFFAGNDGSVNHLSAEAQDTNSNSPMVVFSGGVLEDNTYYGTLLIKDNSVYLYTGSSYVIGSNNSYGNTQFSYDNNVDMSKLQNFGPANGPYTIVSTAQNVAPTTTATTPPTVLPALITNSSTSVTASSASVSGVVYASSVATTNLGFDYGTSSNLTGSSFATATPASSNANTQGVGITASLSSLNGGTTYYYRSVGGANGISGTGTGIIKSFLTIPSPPATPTASSVSAAGFTLNWQAVTGAASYQLDVSTVNTFASFVNGYNNLSVSGTSQSVSGLSAGTYYFRVRASDAGGVGANSTTGSQALNSPPAIGGAVAGQAVNDNATIPPFTTVTISDADAAQTESVSVTLDAAAKGSFTTLNGFTNAGNGVYTYSGTAANAQTAIRGLVFSPTPNRVPVGSTETTTFTISVNDGVAAAVTNNTTSVVSTSVNDAPVLAGTSTISYTENSAATIVNSNITVNDSDNATLASGAITITNVVSGQDVLAFTNNGSTMGNITGNYNLNTGMLTLTSAGSTATLANFQAALRSVSYSNTSNNPSTTARTVTFIVKDASLASNAVSSTINIISVNNAPVLAGTSTISYTENSAATIVNSNITVSDVDNATLASGAVTITNVVSGQDVLAFTNNGSTMGNITGNYNLSTGMLTLTSAGSTATLANFQAALRSVSYSNTSNNPSTTARTVTFIVKDASLASNAVSSTINIISVNNAPVLAGTSTISYTENSAATIVNSNITVSDVDNATLASGAVTITNVVSGQDVLAVTNNGSTMGNITGSYNLNTGVLTLTSAGSTATLANFQAALRSVSYSNTSEDLTTTARTVTFTVNDGSLASNTVSSTINVISVNDAPVLAGTNTITYTGGSTAMAIDLAITVSDVDNTNQAGATVSITTNFETGDILSATTTGTAIAASYDSSTGLLNLTGTDTKANYQQVLQSVTYYKSTTKGASKTVSFTVNDGTANSNIITCTINTNAPVIANNTPLDKVNNNITASAAYSLRQLKSTYTHAAITAPAPVSGFTNSTTPLIRASRSNDNALLDIGYTANGDLDTVTLKRFVGTNGGYVAIWYDQSGNSYDAAQTNRAQRPIVVTNGRVERSGIVPAVRFENPAQTVLTANVAAGVMFGSGYAGSVFPVYEATDANVHGSVFGYGNAGDRWQVHGIAGANFDVGNPSVDLQVQNASYARVIKNYSFIAGASGQAIYANGTLAASSATALTPCTQTQFNIGGIPNFNYYHDGRESELIVYGSAVTTADRQTVEANQAVYYGTASVPAITAFSPQVGPPGTTVTITGINLNGATNVYFGGVAAASFTVVSGTTITATVGAGTTGLITVVTPTGTATISGGLFAGPLDKAGITGVYANAAYSLRQLKTTYTHTAITAPAPVSGVTNSTSPVIRVRRSNDNALLDIGYTANGDLDTVTLKKFVGTGGGYIAVWYDQSGNSYDVAQTVYTIQPIVVTNGTVERSGVMPAVRFVNASQTLLQANIPASTMFGSGYIGTVLPVFEASAANIQSSVFGYGNNTDRWQVHGVAGAYFDVGSPSNRVFVSNASLVGAINTYAFVVGVNQQAIYINGVLQASSAAVVTPCTQSQFNIGGIPSFNYFHQGHESEIIIYNTVLSAADQQAAQANQAAYYMPTANNLVMAVAMQQPQAMEASINLPFVSNGGVGTTTYALQKQTGSGAFSDIATLTGQGTGSFTSADLDPINGASYYKVQATDSKGNQAYSAVLRVNIANARGTSIAPNPLLNKQVTVNFTRMPKGRYSFVMVSMSGYVVDKRTLSYDGDSPSVTFAAPANAHTGVYLVTISCSGYKRTEKVVVE